MTYDTFYKTKTSRRLVCEECGNKTQWEFAMLVDTDDFKSGKTDDIDMSKKKEELVCSKCGSWTPCGLDSWRNKE